MRFAACGFANCGAASGILVHGVAAIVAESLGVRYNTGRFMIEQLRMATPVLWPAMAIAAGLMLVTWWPRCDRAGAPVAPRERGWAGALAFGLAFIAAFLVIAGGVPFMPLRERWQWLLPIAAVAMLWGVAAGYATRAAWARVLIGVLSAVSAGLMFRPLASLSNPLAWKAAVAALTLVSWVAMEGSARRHKGFLTPLLLCAIFAAASVIILSAGNANISLLAAALAAALGIVAIIALLLPPLSLASGAMHVLASMLAAILATAWMYRIGEPRALTLLAATPLLLRASELLVGRREGWLCLLVRVAAVMGPIALAVAVAIAAGGSADDGAGA